VHAKYVEPTYKESLGQRRDGETSAHSISSFSRGMVEAALKVLPIRVVIRARLLAAAISKLLGGGGTLV